MANSFFGRVKKTPRSRYGTCLLLDSSSRPVARGDLTAPPESETIQLRVTEGDPQDVVKAQILQVIASDESVPVRLGKVIRQRDMEVVLEPLRALGAEVRQNLRMPVDFESYVYPESGGQLPVHVHDLSSGGIAFLTSETLEEHERFEIVIPITIPNPLILWSEVIRRREKEPSVYLYACRFFDLIDDEEFLVREAVFNVQLKSR